ncbi:sensor histidine kinase [Eisenbergiella porci]|uniref:sensor histidine kinase n=1 Tax=Eisenbergiella porci TaxID=2652274 RepID=UPI002A8412FC|nr:histidine kinase [Eisenbergiella porci]
MKRKHLRNRLQLRQEGANDRNGKMALMHLAFAAEAAELSAAYGDFGEGFYNSLESSAEKFLDYAKLHPGFRNNFFSQRLFELHYTANVLYIHYNKISKMAQKILIKVMKGDRNMINRKEIEARLRRIYTIQSKILAVCLLLAIGITLISLIFSYYTEINSYRKIAESYLTQYIRFADQSFDNMISEARKISLSISMSNEMIYPILDNELTSEVSYHRFLQKKRITNFLSGLMTQKEYIADIMIITRDGSVYQAGQDLIVRKDLQADSIQKALRSEKARIIYDGKKETVIYSWPIYYKNEIKATGIIKLNYTDLVDAYNMEPLRTSTVIINIPGDTVFYRNRGDDRETEYILQEIGKKEKDTGYIKINGEKQYYIKNHSDTGFMSISVLIPYSVLSKDAEKLKSKFIVIGICAVAAAVFCSIILSRKLCENLKKLSYSMEEIRQGNLEVRMSVQTRDEIGIVADTFNRMMDHIARLMVEIKEKEILKKEAEQKFLDAQIEPHFLYNSINSIQYVAHMREEKEIEKVAIALSELFRSVLSNKKEFITLWEEKEYIDNYIMIERFKYTRDFALIWDVEEELWAYQIPRLLLQPIVENALIHGIADKEEGVINIKVYREENSVIVKILDNGKGIARKELQELQEDIHKNKKSRFRRVGISNVFERIKLLFGEEYGGNIYSYQNTFTCIELKLPLNVEQYM